MLMRGGEKALFTPFCTPTGPHFRAYPDFSDSFYRKFTPSRCYKEKATAACTSRCKLSSPLFDLPFGPPNDPQTLASRNLLRHLTFSLPSGQEVAKAMGIELLSRKDLKDVKLMGFDQQTPLWFYILKESEVKTEGRTLGPVGGRIVAEVFIGILQGDPMSYLQKEPNWKPTLGQNQDFRMADLLRFADVA
jgi:hypothetical protein